MQDTPERMAQILDYNPESGALTWKARGPESFDCAENEKTRVASRWTKMRAGKIAGTVAATGYRVVCIEKRTYPAHRIAWAVAYGEWPRGQIDHINHDRADNRLSNLRDVTPSENAQNRRRAKTNTSGALGVHFHKPSGKWHARIWQADQRHHLGAFDSLAEAAAARAAASKELGFHSNHGAA